MITINHAYANLVVGHAYKMVKEGYDWYLLRVLGYLMYVPKWVGNESTGRYFPTIFDEEGDE